MNKLITIPLRDFAVPAPRTGNIEAHSGYGRSAVDGVEIHTRVQKQRAKQDPLYQAEVPVSSLFERAGFSFRIDGRMDGIFRHDPPKIEEIKTTFSLWELSQRLSGKLLIIPQISTRYSHRERNYARVADAVQRITALCRGNYFVFLPSFEFLERVTALFRPPEGFTVMRQERGMKAAGVEAIVESLRSQSLPTIVFAVQGGSFSEGMDYAGETVIGAFVVGPPLPD